MYAHVGRFQLSGWRVPFLLLMLGGVATALLGIHLGSSSTIQFSDTFPSGLCFGLNVLCGIALAVGSLTVATVANIIGGSEWRVITRASLLVGCLSYLVTILGGVPDEIEARHWQVWIGGWSSRSVIDGAIWTTAILSVLLFIEFLPVRSQQYARRSWYAGLSRLELPLLIFATSLAAIQQFGLKRWILLSEAKLSPLWTGPSLLPLFYLSSVALGLAVLLCASWRSFLAFRKGLPVELQPVLARLLAAAVFVYLTVRLIDLVERGLLWSVFGMARENLLIMLELALLLCGMLWIHGSEREPGEVFVGSALIIAGVIANRLNTAITSLEIVTGQQNLPRWGEFLICYSLIAAGVAGFALAVKHLGVFPEVQPSAA